MTAPQKKKILYYSILVVFLALIFYVLRGPNISNELKKAILPELEEATGKKFVAQKIYVNLIPFFVEIKDLKAFDDDGNKVLTVERVKGYLSVTGFFDKQIVIKRLVIKKCVCTRTNRRLRMSFTMLPVTSRRRASFRSKS